MNNQKSINNNRNTNYYKKEEKEDNTTNRVNNQYINTNSSRIVLPSQEHPIQTGGKRNNKNQNLASPFIRQHLSHSPILQSQTPNQTSHYNQQQQQQQQHQQQQQQQQLPQLQRYQNQTNERRMSFTMFSPNATTSPLYPITSNTRGNNSNNNNNNSPSNANSPGAIKKIKQEDYLYHASTLPPSPLAGSSLQPNISYTRRSNQISTPSATNFKKAPSPENENEDERFLRLARDALVATARGIDQRNRGLVDPTISDLLTRLQYASSPHGNPIAKSENLQTNVSGQLNIQEFYESFPNLSNDIFSGNQSDNQQDKKIIPINDQNSGGNSNSSGLLKSRHHPAGNASGWNFLIGEPLQLKADSERSPLNNLNVTNDFQKSDHDILNKPQLPKTKSSGKITKKTKQPKSQSLQQQSQLQQQNSTTNDPSRKFLCSKCSMSFRRSSDLKRHEKQHLSIPPNICEFCGKGFARKDALKRHIGTLTCKRNADKKLYIDNLNYLKNKINLNQKVINDQQHLKQSQQQQQHHNHNQQQEEDEADDGDDDDNDDDDDDDDDDDEEDEEEEDIEDDNQVEERQIKKIKTNTNVNDDRNNKNNEDSPKFPTYGYQKSNW
ncbi:MET32 [Candida pseudojiufengensis]|uniref:MET32 n=1 Tax=Candida pseudojiufengensis TaxID=497109 RepID=UPI002224FBEC|nr:MET32 [Candida pseudojiufengensis]KAI5966904.1 MET32 [Candida pseudojiufengensis]